LFGSILLLDVPKNLLDVFFERVIINKHNLGRIPSYSNNFPFDCFVVHEIIDISLDLIEGYTLEITNNIYYFSWLATKQVLVKEDVDIYGYKEIIKLSSIFIENIWCFNGCGMFLYRKY
jgi:hypothetical protein